jgi:molybdenum cofactor biosynthesis protein B
LKPPEEHRAAARRKLGFFVATVSTSRYRDMKARRAYTDESGDAAEEIIGGADHQVVGRDLVSDDPVMIRSLVQRRTRSPRVDVVLLTGGTGISPTDVTIETVRPLFEKELPGVGELLRTLSYERIGAAAMLTRATAGIVHRKLVLCLPGSPDAVETALRATISDLPHAVHIARGGRTELTHGR